MVFVTRKPGEVLVLDTPNGKLVIQVLGDNQLAIDAPAGVRVAGPARTDLASWLPPRPKLVQVA